MDAGVAAIVTQLDDLIAEIQASKTYDHDTETTEIYTEDARRLYTRGMAAIARLAPRGSPYSEQANQIEASYIEGAALEIGHVLEALRDDYKADAMQGVEELVHAAVFDDFLDMARELHDKNFVAPAAVLAGSVLEEHIRKLAAKAEIAVTEGKRKLSFDTLASSLVKAGTFSEPQRKILLGWYAQRNQAAHGHFENVIDEEVSRMIDGIRDFLTRHPA